MAAPKRQFCPRGHDTFTIGRDSSGRCLRCKREDMATSRYVRLAEAMAAESARIRKEHEKRDRQREAERRRILEKGTPAQVLELKQMDAWEQDRCGWELSETEVCQRRGDPMNSWCTMHLRQLDRERVGRSVAPATTAQALPMGNGPMSLSVEARPRKED
jgi:hypothetical protein